MGIPRLLHSSCCFLNTNTAITRQLIRKARTSEAEWWQVCEEEWVRGQRKMSQVLGAFGLLDFTIVWPVLAWRAFWNLWTVYFFNFPNFFSGRGKPRIWGSACNYKMQISCSRQILLYNVVFHTMQSISQCSAQLCCTFFVACFYYTDQCAFMPWSKLI